MIVYFLLFLLHNYVKEVCKKMLKIQGKPESISKTFRLPIDMIEKLDKIAYKNNISLNQLVIQCLDFAIDNIDTGEASKNDED